MCGCRAGAPANPLDPSAIPKALPLSRFDCGAGFLHQRVDQIDVVIREQARREHPKSAAPLAMLGDLDLELQTYDAAIAQLKQEGAAA